MTVNKWSALIRFLLSSSLYSDKAVRHHRASFSDTDYNKIQRKWYLCSTCTQFVFLCSDRRESRGALAYLLTLFVCCLLTDFQRTFTQDGVCLTESGLCQLQSLCVQTTRRRRQKPKLKLKIINQNSVAVLQTPPDPQSELFRDGDVDDCRGKSL